MPKLFISFSIHINKKVYANCLFHLANISIKEIYMPRLCISLCTPIKNRKFLDTTEQIVFNAKPVYCTIERDDVKT